MVVVGCDYLESKGKGWSGCWYLVMGDDIQRAINGWIIQDMYV